MHERSLLSPQQKAVWDGQRRAIPRIIDSMPPETGRLVREAPDLIEPFERFADLCTRFDFCTGPRVREAMGYASAGVSAYSGVVHSYLKRIAHSSDELFAAAQAKFAQNSRSPFGFARAQLSEIEAFLRSNPHYQRIRQDIRALPRFIQARLGQMELPVGPSANARWARSQILIPKSVDNPAAYLGRVASRLGPQVVRFGRIAGRTTWFIPAVLGVIETASAKPGARVQTFSREAMGVLWGYGGAVVGASAVAVVGGSLALPGSIILLACIVGAAGGGLAGSHFGKQAGGIPYDVFSEAASFPIARSSLIIAE